MLGLLTILYQNIVPCLGEKAVVIERSDSIEREIGPVVGPVVGPLVGQVHRWESS